MKKKAFTLVELLVVIAIIALLVSILMPALGRARELAKRVQCQSNLGALGRSIVMYEGEYRDKMPKPWRYDHPQNNHSFGSGAQDMYRQDGDFNRVGTYNKIYFMMPMWHSLGYETYNSRQNVGLCLYLLVKHEGADPKSFICPSAERDTEMILENITEAAQRLHGYMIEFWSDLNNFQSMYNLSYSYHDPWNTYGVQEDSAIMADKSNVFDTERGVVRENALGPDMKPIPNNPPENTDWTDLEGANPMHGNSKNHRTECQNVLFKNSSVKRSETPCVGMAGDNIYTRWGGPTGMGGMFSIDDKQIMGVWGNLMQGWALHARGRADSYLGN